MVKLSTLQSAISPDKVAKVKNSMSGPLIFLSFVTLFNTCKMQGIESSTNLAIKAYTKAPVLVQLAPDGKTVTAKRVTEGNLNDLNITQFVNEVVLPLYRYDRALPAELGGGIDPGVTVPEVDGKVSTLHWIMSQAFVAPETRAIWLADHLKAAPERFAEGATSLLMAPSVRISPLAEGSDTRVVTLTATRVVADKNGTIVQRGLWERDIELRAALIVKPLIKPNKLELALSYARQRGLEIVSIRPVQQQEPKK